MSHADPAIQNTRFEIGHLDPMRIPRPRRVPAVTLLYFLAPAITLFVFWCIDRPMPINARGWRSQREL